MEIYQQESEYKRKGKGKTEKKFHKPLKINESINRKFIAVGKDFNVNIRIRLPAGSKHKHELQMIPWNASHGHSILLLLLFEKLIDFLI